MFSDVYVNIANMSDYHSLLSNYSHKGKIGMVQFAEQVT